MKKILFITIIAFLCINSYSQYRLDNTFQIKLGAGIANNGFGGTVGGEYLLSKTSITANLNYFSNPYKITNNVGDQKSFNVQTFLFDVGYNYSFNFVNLPVMNFTVGLGTHAGKEFFEKNQINNEVELNKIPSMIYGLNAQFEIEFYIKNISIFINPRYYYNTTSALQPSIVTVMAGLKFKL